MSLPAPPTALQFWDIFSAFFIIGLVAGGIVVGLMTYYGYANRNKIGRREFKISHKHFRSRAREAIVIAAISTTMLFILATYSNIVATQLQTPPDSTNQLTVGVTAFQWAFEFTYPNNQTIGGNCRIPEDTVIVFNVTSLDVMHDFGLPAFKIKIDAIPGRYNILTMKSPSLEGQNELVYQIKCYELCGSGHTYMMANLTVMSKPAFEQFLSGLASGQGGT